MKKPSPPNVSPRIDETVTRPIVDTTATAEASVDTGTETADDSGSAEMDVVLGDDAEDESADDE